MTCTQHEPDEGDQNAPAKVSDFEFEPTRFHLDLWQYKMANIREMNLRIRMTLWSH
jgi:hypothetical protein